MGFKTSEGLRNSLLDKTKADLDGGKIYLYGGVEPTSPNDDITGRVADLINTISKDGLGTGLTFAAPSAGILLKEPTETWIGSNVQTLAVSWYRFKAPGDDDTLSTTQKRVQGSVGVLNADLLVANATLVDTEDQRIDYYAIGLPASI